MSKKKVVLQRIANDKKRITTYKKRKECLYKKAYEFSTLCGVETCLIVYGPTKATDEVVSEPEVWPRDETKVRDIIRNYIDKVSNSCKKETYVETFVNNIGKAKEMDNINSKRVKNQNNIVKYCSWEEKLEKCSQEELSGIFYAVEHKLNEALVRQDHSMIRVNHHQATETPNIHSLVDQYNYMPRYLAEQQQLLMLPNTGFSLFPSRDDQIQMDQNLMGNWSGLRLGNYNVEPFVQNHAAFTLNPGYYGGFNP